MEVEEVNDIELGGLGEVWEVVVFVVVVVEFGGEGGMG